MSQAEKQIAINATSRGPLPIGKTDKPVATAGEMVRGGILHIVLILLSITMVGPFFWMALSGLKDTADIFRVPPTLFPSVWQWGNIWHSLTVLPFGTAYFNSAYISIVIVLGQLLTCSMAAFAFAKIQFPMKNFLFILFLATLMVPAQVTIVPLYLIMKQLGWIDSHLSLIVPGVLFNAFGVFLLRQFFMSVPNELHEAAVVDGGNMWQIYTRIMLPLVRPALAALGITSFLGNWNNFFYPLIFLNTPARFTVPLLLNLFKGLYAVDWPDMMAASTIAILPMLLIYIIGQKYFIEGIAITGIK